MSRNHLKPLVFSFFLLGIFPLLYSYTPDRGSSFTQCSGKILVKTDKDHYEPGDSIEITLINKLKESIWSHAASQTPAFAIEHIEKANISGVLDTLYVRCDYPECLEDTDAPQEIFPGTTVTFKWYPQIFPGGSTEHFTAGQGRYRLSILYMDADKKEWKHAYSDEFKIE